MALRYKLSTYLVLTLFVSLIAAYACLGWAIRDRIRSGNSDFLIYYTGARMVSSGNGAGLYNIEQQSQFQQELLGSMGSSLKFQDRLLPYNHPPFQLGWYYLLSFLPYLSAFWLWNLTSLLCYLFGMNFLLTATLPPQKGEHTNIFFYAGGLAFFPVAMSFIQGQDSLMMFVWFALAYFAFRRDKDFAAGLGLSLALQKFQLVLPVILLISWKRRWKALGGLVTGGCTLLVVSILFVGLGATKSYFRLIAEMSQWTDIYGIYPAKMHCLRGQFFLLFQDFPHWLPLACTLATSALFLALVAKTWKGRWNAEEPQFDLKYALVILVTLLVSPHLNFHDLSLFLIPGVLILRWYLASGSGDPWVQRLVPATFLFSYFLVLVSVPFSNSFPLQLTVLGLAALALLVAYIVQQENRLPFESN